MPSPGNKTGKGTNKANKAIKSTQKGLCISYGLYQYKSLLCYYMCCLWNVCMATNKMNKYWRNKQATITNSELKYKVELNNRAQVYTSKWLVYFVKYASFFCCLNSTFWCNFWHPSRLRTLTGTRPDKSGSTKDLWSISALLAENCVKESFQQIEWICHCHSIGVKNVIKTLYLKDLI